MTIDSFEHGWWCLQILINFIQTEILTYQFGIRKFYGYKAHFSYLDYFVKTDVAMREGQMHPSSGGMQKQQQKQEKKDGANEETPQV